MVAVAMRASNPTGLKNGSRKVPILPETVYSKVS